MTQFRKTPELFQHLIKVLSDDRFLKMQGLNQEVPFFLCPFPVTQKLEIEDMLPNLEKRLHDRGIRIVDINLYDLCLDYLRKNDLLEQLCSIEPDTEKGFFLESLQSMLDIESILVPEIENIISAAGKVDVLFLTGVGEVFPYIRTHNILNNLQRAAKAFPTVLFFPGEYEQSLEKGASLRLFGRLPDDKYYRAYDITRYEI
jgi:hypothetical protein